MLWIILSWGKGHQLSWACRGLADALHLISTCWEGSNLPEDTVWSPYSRDNYFQKNYKQPISCLWALFCEFRIWPMPYACLCHAACKTMFPHSKVHRDNMGPTWGRQDPGGPHVGPINFAIWVVLDHLIWMPDSIINAGDRHLWKIVDEYNCLGTVIKAVHCILWR